MATLYLRDYPTAYHHAPHSMPSMGIADELLAHATPDPVERYRFWLLTHVAGDGAAFWSAAVLRECLPDPDADLVFVLDGELLR